MTSRLNIYYNFQIFWAVCCPKWFHSKCTKRKITANSGKMENTGKNAQKFLYAWDSRFWYQPNHHHHIEKLLWIAVWIYIIISRLSWLFVVPSGTRESVQSGKERVNRPKQTKTKKNAQKFFNAWDSPLSHWKIFVTSRLNIYYNFQIFLAVFCPNWYPRKRIKRTRKGKSAKFGKKAQKRTLLKSQRLGENHQSTFDCWQSFLGTESSWRNHIEKF